MKRKLRLLVMLLLTMAMVMGINITVVAATLRSGGYVPDSCECSGEHSADKHFYATGETYEGCMYGYFYGERGTCAEGRMYNGTTLTDFEDGYEFMGFGVNDYFGGHASQGWYYVVDNGMVPELYPCSGHASSPDPEPAPKTTDEVVFTDHDTFKSSVPSKTVTLLNANGKFDMDMKVHPSSEKSITNQKLLVTTFAKQLGKIPNIVLTEDVFMRNDLLTSRYGQKDMITWNDLSHKVSGAIYAVVYNQTDGAYLICGYIDTNGNAKLNGFILRPASTITIFAVN